VAVTPDRVGCVVNPASGAGRGRALLGDLRGLFPDSDLEATVTERDADVPEAAHAHADADLLVVVGGDGTVGEVAGTLADEGAPPLFVVPAGRGNSVYRHCYGDAAWRDVARDLARGVDARPLDLGEVRTEPPVDRHSFVLGFTAGLFRSALDAADSLRFLPGPLAYLLGTARAAVSDPPLEVTVTVDDTERFDGSARLVAVGGGRYRGNAFELLPDSRPGDGRLHALVVESTSAREWIRLARLARDGDHVAHPAVHYWQGETVGLQAADPLPVEADGTVLTPVRDAQLRVRPGAVQLAVPSR
jgi:diacylglycerol kinase family enzyme